MGQIANEKSVINRANIRQLSDTSANGLANYVPAAGEIILISSDNSMTSTGRGNFDSYISGDGSTKASLRELKKITPSDALMLTDIFSLKVVNGKNMIDPAKYVNGKYINSSGVEVGNAPTWSHTEFIPVEAGVEYYAVGVNNLAAITAMRFVNWYDSAKVHIRQDGNLAYVTAPQNAAYCICSTYNNDGNYPILKKTGLFKGHLVFAQFEEYYEKYYLLCNDDRDFSDKDNNAIVLKSDVINDKTKTNLLGYTPETISENNLLNPSAFTKGYYRNAQIATAYEIMAYSEEIPVAASTLYSVLAFDQFGILGAARFVAYYDSAGIFISVDALVSQFTTPSNCAYVVISLYYKNQNGDEFDLSQTGVFAGSTYTFEPYVLQNSALSYLQKTAFKKKANDELVVKGDVMSYLEEKSCAAKRSENSVEFSSGENKLTATLKNKNDIFNLLSVLYDSVSRSISDEIAPTHTQNMTLGANHGDVCYKVTAANHGLGNTYIGTEWQGSNGQSYIIMEIPDANNIVFQGKNSNNRSFPVFYYLPADTVLTRNGVSITASTVAQYQLYPVAQDISQNILLDGKEVSGDFNAECESMSVVEQYDIISVADIQDNIIARAGESSAPEYVGDAMLRVHNTFEFQKGLSIVATGTYLALLDMRFNDYMLLQAGKITGAKYYIPNSLPINGYDFRVPVSVPWSSSLPSFLIDENAWAENNNPVNRVLMLTDGECLAIGFVPVGVGASLEDYTDNTFEIRNNTGKIYPHGVNYLVGRDMEAGDIYTVSLYMCRFMPQTGPRLALYHYKFGEYTYVYVDYSASKLDFVEVESSLNGKAVELVESKNTELLSGIYNGGFYVKANYVSNDTCYIVVRIKN